MASAKGGVHVLQLKPPEIPEILCKGDRFFKFDDDPTGGCFVILRVDPKGNIIYWSSTSTDSLTEYLDFSTVVDVRYGKYAKVPRDVEKARDQFAGSFVIPASSFDTSFLTIVSGNNTLVEERLVFLSFLAPSPDIAETWGEAIFKISRNLLSLNGSVLSHLNKVYAKIRYGSSPGNSQIRCKDIIRLFAGNRDEKKIVEKALHAAHIPYGKNDSIPLENFSEDHFFNFYRCLTARCEVGKIFADIQCPGSPTSPHGSNKKSAKLSNATDQTITVEQFVRFLNNEQRDPRLNEILYPYYTEKSAQRLINQYEPNKETAKRGLLTIDGFLRYLLSEDNRVLAEEQFDLRVEDMHEPLAHYFINSSHNTYLSGHQYRSKSSVEMYRQALLAGCRSIELDCWDGKYDEPVITHGPAAITMVTQISFKDVIEAIAESAFKTSEYPVILSFENHCSYKQQEKMARYCRDIFGEMLLKEPLPSHPLEPGVPLPSPELLKRKIIIKNKKIHLTLSQMRAGSRDPSLKLKKPKVSLTQSTIEDSGVGHSLSTSSSVGAGGPSEGSLESNMPPEPPRSASETSTIAEKQQGDGKCSAAGGENQDNASSNDEPSSSGVTADAEGDEDGDGVESDTDDVDLVPEEDSQLQNIVRTRKEMKTEVGRELSELVNYMCAMGSFRSFEECEKRNMSSELYSMVEVRALNMLTNYPVPFVNHNKRRVTRVYPKGTRVDSSNYIPQAYWNAGCQMVALNFQTLDLPMQLNLGMFEMNGRSGYILKPECMRKKDRYFDPFETDTVENIVANTVRIKIISGQLLSTLSDKRLNTMVEVEMYGLSVDTVRRRMKTKTTTNNGINPTYENGQFEFKKVVLPDLATLRIVVSDESGKMLGHRILPVVGLRPGYRHIILRNAANQSLGPASLFVRIEVKDFVPEAHADVVSALVDPISAMARMEYFANALVNPIAHRQEMELHQEMLKQLIDEDDAGASKSARDPRRQMTDMNGPSAAGSSPLLAPHAAISSSSAENQSSHLETAGFQQSNLQPQKPLSAGSWTDQSTPYSWPYSAPSSLTASMKKKGFSTAPNTPQCSSTIGSAKRGKFVLDTYAFPIPSGIDELMEDKKVEKLKKKQEKDLELLRQKHAKDRDRLRKKHLKRVGELESSQSQSQGRTHSFLERANMSVLRRVDRTNNDGDVGKVVTPQGSLKNERKNKQEPNLEITKIKDEQDKEFRSLCSQQWREESNLLEEQQICLKNTLISVVDQSEKKCLTTLDMVYNKEVQELMKRNMDERKASLNELAKSSASPDEIAKQKTEIQNRTMKATVDQRRMMAQAKEKRGKDINTAFEDLRKKLESDHQEKLNGITSSYADRIARGDYPDELTPL